MRVLLVEDHPALREMMTDYLAQRGFAVDPVGCAGDARAALDAVSYDLLILDLGLPDVDGMVILRETRARTAGGLPILLVTARDSLEDRLQGANARGRRLHPQAIRPDRAGGPLVRRAAPPGNTAAPKFEGRRADL